MPGVLDPIDVRAGTRIRLRRRILRMSQTDLGKQIGVSFQQVQKYEKGVNRISASRMAALSQALCVPPSFFVVDADSNSDGDTQLQRGHVDYSTFLKSRESMDFNRALLAIRDEGVRANIDALVHSLAEAKC